VRAGATAAGRDSRDDDETRSEMMSVGMVIVKGGREWELAGAFACAGLGPLGMVTVTDAVREDAAGSDGAPLFGTR
jgi:hypothetical protein